MGGENSYIIGSANGVKVFRRGIFIALYFVAIIYITILSRSAYLNLNVRLIPFQSYYEWILGNWNRGSSILLNIVLFVPFGYLITEENSWRRVICECLGASVVIEIIQLITMHGICEVDDLFSNMFGGYLGYITYQIVNKKIAEKFVKYMPHLMLLAGLIGCFIASGNTQVYETQFDFRVFRIIASGDQLNLEGICKVYNRDNLPYQILLKSPDNERILSVVITEDNFSATVTDENVELYVRFRGYKPIATGVYLENGEIEYVEPGTPRPDITDTFINATSTSGNAERRIENFIAELLLYEVRELTRIARMLRHWKTEIINSFDRVNGQRISNGPIESANSRIKVIKQNGAGYRNFERFKLRVLYSLNDNSSIKI